MHQHMPGYPLEFTPKLDLNGQKSQYTAFAKKRLP